MSLIPRYSYQVSKDGHIAGPPKDSIVTATKLAQVGDGMIDAILQDLGMHPETNHLGDENIYPLSSGTAHPGYRQVLLQHRTTDGMSEMDYTNDDPRSASVRVAKQLWPRLRFFRARLMILSPEHEVPWHVDSDTTDFVRLHVLAQGECRWRFRRNRSRLHFNMRVGDLWFTNVGWLHTISNTSAVDRVMFTMHAPYSDMLDQFGDLVENAVDG